MYEARYDTSAYWSAPQPTITTIDQAFDLCSVWLASVDDLAAVAAAAAELLVQTDLLLANPALSWLRRMKVQKDRAETAARIDALYMEHANAAAQVNYWASIIDAMVTNRHGGSLTLPVVRSSLILPLDETARFEGMAALERTVRNHTQLHSGSMIIADRRILFESAEGVSETPIASLMRVNWSVSWPSRPFIALVGKNISQKYFVRDAVRIANIVQMLIQMQNRHILPTNAYEAQRDTRHVAQHIRAAVWQRDQGRCVECGAGDYLEYDHIIPWSKGGATSVENLQLLCRRCNSKKRDRI